MSASKTMRSRRQTLRTPRTLDARLASDDARRMRLVCASLTFLLASCGADRPMADRGERPDAGAADAAYTGQCSHLAAVEMCDEQFSCSSALPFEKIRECVRSYGACLLAAREGQAECYEQWGCDQAIAVLDCVRPCEDVVFSACLDEAHSNAALDHCRGPAQNCYFACGTQRHPTDRSTGFVCY